MTITRCALEGEKSYIVDDVVYFVCSATGTGKGLEVRGRLTQRKGPDQNSKEHLGTQPASTVRLFSW